MTREELERRVRRLLPLGSMKRADAERTADAVIRLVVEACISKSAFFLGGDAGLGAVLRSTFLPPKDRSNG